MPYQALLNAYYVQGCSGSFRVWLSSAVILPGTPPPPQTISISLSPPAGLTGNSRRGQEPWAFRAQCPYSMELSARGWGGARASCLQEFQGPSGVVLKTGLGAAPPLWLPGRGLQHTSQLGSDRTPVPRYRTGNEEPLEWWPAGGVEWERIWGNIWGPSLRGRVPPRILTRSSEGTRKKDRYFLPSEATDSAGAWSLYVPRSWGLGPLFSEWLKASSCLAQTVSLSLRLPYGLKDFHTHPHWMGGLSMGRDLLGDSNQTCFIEKAPPPGPGGNGQQDSEEINLSTSPAACPSGYPTGIDPGPEGS